MDPISETRLEEVHPKVAAAIRQLSEMLAAESIEIRVTQALRSWAQQQALWQEGRDSQGNVIGTVVTDAKAGYSWHNFGLATDVAPFDANGPDWNIKHPAWQRIVAVGVSLGLVSGSEWRTFPDWPHLQLSGIPITPTDQDRENFLDGGITRVWQAYDL
jgi:peptidoglycan L-alanyl-D-glutamate endopeptidase CwlK